MIKWFQFLFAHSDEDDIKLLRENNLLQNEASEASQYWNKLTANFRRGYNKISECYRLGKSVQKDREKAKMYKLKAEEIVKKMNAIVSANPIPADLK